MRSQLPRNDTVRGWHSVSVAPAPDEMYMRAATVEDIAREFMRIIAEGYSPEPEEFLHRVPTDMREDCRVRLEELLAEHTEPESAPEPEAFMADAVAAEVVLVDLDEPEVADEPDVAEEPQPESLEAEVLVFDLSAPQAAAPARETSGPPRRRVSAGPSRIRSLGVGTQGGQLGVLYSGSARRRRRSCTPRIRRTKPR